jgi:uncharacterized protein
MDVYRTHGAFSWSELMTPNPAAASEFYGALFGWTSEVNDMGTGPYHVIKVGDTSIGGMMAPPPGSEGMPPMWGVYVTVDDIDATVARCTQLGGKVLMPPMEVKTVGRMAVLQDPQGAVFSAITYESQ